MLSFMKDQQSAPLPGSDDTGGEATAGEQFYTVSGRGKKARNSTAFFMALFGLGAVGLWFMTQQSKSKSVSASEVSDEVQIEVAISRLTGVSTEMEDRMDKIVNKFYEFSDVPQVEVTELRKNPFELETYSAVAEAEASVSDEEQALADAKRILRQQMLNEWNELHLVSVMHSPQGARCVIDDVLVREGDGVGHFRVLEIHDDSAELLWEPSSVDLEIMPLATRRATLMLSE